MLYSIWNDGCPNGESKDQICTRVDTLIAKIQKIHQDYVEKMQKGEPAGEGADVLIVSHGHYSKCESFTSWRFPDRSG